MREIRCINEDGRWRAMMNCLRLVERGEAGGGGGGGDYQECSGERSAVD